MPIQSPQWTDFLSCPICFNEFNDAVRQPISLGCGHTACKQCLLKLHQKKCPFDQTPINSDLESLPVNAALLQLVAPAGSNSGASPSGAPQQRDEASPVVPLQVPLEYVPLYHSANKCIEELALYLRPLSSAASAAAGGGTGSSLLSRPMQRKLVTLINCQLVEEEGKSRAMRAARSLGERTVTELILQ